MTIADKLDETSQVGRAVTYVYPETGEECLGEVEGEASVVSGRYKFVIQRIKLDDGYDSSHSYRFAYFVYSKKSKRVRFVPRPLTMTAEQCKQLIDEAKRLGWKEFI